MKAPLQKICDDYLVNMEAVREAFLWDSSYLYPVCANVFCVRGKTADAEQLKRCKKIINEQTGVLSNFRGNIRPILAAMLALSDQPEARMAQAKEYYDLLKQEFWGSEYLALVSFLLTERADPQQVEEKASRGRAIYRRMKQEHPFLTSSEDSVFAVLMAYSEKTDDELIDDMEGCYTTLKERFFVGNELQTVSHVLAMADGRPEEKAGRVIELYNALRDAGVKYGKDYALATLAALSVTDAPVPELVQDIQDVETFLDGKKGYGFFGYGTKQRTIHAAMLVADQYTTQDTVNTAAMTSSLAMVIAMEMAMCAMAASAAASTAASSSSN